MTDLPPDKSNSRIPAVKGPVFEDAYDVAFCIFWMAAFAVCIFSLIKILG